MRLTPRLAPMLSMPPLLWAGNAGVGRLAIRSIPPLWAAGSLAGVAVVLARGDLAALRRVQLVPGDLLMLLAILSGCVYSWWLARPPPSLRGGQRPAWHWAEFLCIQIAMGLAWATAGARLGEWLHPHSTPIHWTPWLVAALAYVAIGPSLIAYRLWGLGVAQAGPAVATFFGNLTPLFAALLSAALLGEWPQPFHGLPFSLIVAGIVVSSRPTPAARS